MYIYTPLIICSDPPSVRPSASAALPNPAPLRKSLADLVKTLDGASIQQPRRFRLTVDVRSFKVRLFCTRSVLFAPLDRARFIHRFYLSILFYSGEPSSSTNIFHQTYM